jgi:hypothetical protein
MLDLDRYLSDCNFILVSNILTRAAGILEEQSREPAR